MEIDVTQFKEDNTPPKSAMEEVKEKIALFKKLSYAWTILSLLLSTAFLVYSIISKFGNEIYRYIALGVLGAYIIFFIALLIFAFEGKKKKRMLYKTYKTGIAVFRAILNIVHTTFTIIILLTSFSGSQTDLLLSWIIAIFTLLFAVLTVIFKITVLLLSNVLPKIAKLGAQMAKEIVEEKINENPILNSVVKTVKKRNDKKKLKLAKKELKIQTAEAKRISKMKPSETKEVLTNSDDVLCGEVHSIEGVEDDKEKKSHRIKNAIKLNGENLTAKLKNSRLFKKKIASDDISCDNTND